MDLDISVPFVLFARATVRYDGRAASTLDAGNYLFVYKTDGSFLVHAADSIIPRNYQGQGTTLSMSGATLLARRKRELIKVNIHEILCYQPLRDWSDIKLVLTRTEAELAKKLCSNIDDYLDLNVESVFTEYRTEIGNIDVLAIGAGQYHIIEVKRGTASIAACSQLQRYVDHFRAEGKSAFGYLASPRIAKTALAYCERNGFKWIEVDF